MNGFGTDAGRPSLTKVGDAEVRARRTEACATCGAYFAPGEGTCPNCGSARGGSRSARRRPGIGHAASPLPARNPRGPEERGVAPAPPPAPAGAIDSSLPVPAGAASASSPAPGGVPSPGDPREPARGPPWGERFVAWSALAVLAIAAVFFVQRIGELPAGHGRDEASVAAGPAAPPAPLARATPAAAGGADTATATDNLAPEPDRAIASRRAHRAPPVPVSSVRKPARVAEPRPAPPAPAADERAPIPQPSRWERMREEIALCGPDGFLARMVCELEVRTRYCSGFWGSAAECPSGRTADYGN